MAAITLGIPEQQIRVVAPSVGGGFGSKLNVYADELLALALANKHGRPVRWVEERTENAQGTIHGRGQIQDIELAADADGKVIGVRVQLLADMGAYLQLVTPGIPLLGAFLYGGVYDVPAYSFTCTAVFTTMTPTDAYRGAGRPEATYAIERAMDALAAQVGVDPAELRRRNFIKAEQFPYTAVTGLTYDSGDHEGAAKQGPRAGRLRRRPRRAGAPARSRAAPSTSASASRPTSRCAAWRPSRVLASLNYSAGGWESATVRMLPTGKVQVVTGATPHGQGHETCWSMIVADRLGVDPDRRRRAPLRHRHQPARHGHLRLPLAGRRRRRHRHGLRPGDRQGPADRRPPARGGRGRPRVRRRRSSRCGARPTRRCRSPASPSRRSPPTTCPTAWSRTSRPRSPTTRRTSRGRSAPTSAWSRSTRRPAASTCVKYVAVDDCGNQINPLIVEGQVHGGIIQGLAQALFEEVVYDDDGNLITSTLADYLVPAAADVPSLVLDHTVTPSPTNPLGVKGIGEAGTIGSPPRSSTPSSTRCGPLGVTDVPMPASPLRVWEAIQPRPRSGGGTRRADRAPAKGRSTDPAGRHRHADRRGRCGVIPAAFDYVRADSADEALAALAEHGDEAKLLAGGHSLLPLMKLRLAQPSVLVDVGRLTRPRRHPRRRRPRRHRRPDPPPRRRAHRPAAAAGADPAHAAGAGRRPAGPPPGHHRRLDRPRRPGVGPPGGVLALGGIARGPVAGRGERVIAATDFFTGFLESALEPDELLTEIRVPEGARAPAGRSRSSTGGPRTGPSSASPPCARNGSTGVGLVNMGSTPLRAAAVDRALAGGATPPTRPSTRPRAPSPRPTSTPASSTAPTWPRCSSAGPSRRPARRPIRHDAGMIDAATRPTSPAMSAPRSAEQELPGRRGPGHALFLALRLQRPLLLEGEAGVGKTEVAKVLAGSPAASCCGSSATRASTPPRRSTSGTTPASCCTCGPPRRPGRRTGRRSRTSSTASGSSSAGRCSGPSGTRPTAPPPVLLDRRGRPGRRRVRGLPARDPRRTGRSPSPSSARSGRRSRRSS